MTPRTLVETFYGLQEFPILMSSLVRKAARRCFYAKKREDLMGTRTKQTSAGSNAERQMDALILLQLEAMKTMDEPYTLRATFMGYHQGSLPTQEVSNVEE